MSSQSFSTTRRNFLKRSAQGTGSLLFSSLLLQSCLKDHNLPTPGFTPIALPPTLTMKFDWNDAAKTVVTSGLEMIPEAGEILGPLVEIFWPKSKEDVWGEIKGEVEALIDEKLSDFEYQQVQQQLDGLAKAVNNYLATLKDGTDAEKLIEWHNMNDAFSIALPFFQAEGYQLLLLPLFVQFANMYLAILRDVVISGKEWGRSEKEQSDDPSTLTEKINEFYSYAADTFNQGRLNVALKTKPDNHKCEPFRSINQYDRQMTLTVLDYMNAWPYFDVIRFPNGAPVVSTREIYSDPMGTCDDSGNIVIATPTPTQPLTQLSVWSGDYFNSIQVTYPAGSGPGGVTQTKRMGVSGGFNRVYTISPNNPIVAAQTTYGSIVNTIQFTYADGSTSDVLGKNAGSNNTTWNFDSEILSSVHINGMSNYYGSADCVVYGFQYAKSPSAALYAIQAIYVKSPKERSVGDFAKAFPKFSIPANLITDDLKAARKAHWDYLKTLVKAGK